MNKENAMPMSSKDLYAAIESVLTAGLVPYVHGEPSTAKSSIARQIAEDNNMDFIDIRLAQMEVCDIIGIPVPDSESGTFKYLPLDLIPLVGVHEKPRDTLVLFDEFSSCNDQMQSACYRVLLDRQIGIHDIHDNVHLMCAGNYMEDGAVVETMSSAIQSRVVHLHATISPADWLTWADKNEIDFRIKGFINYAPSLLNNFNDESSKSDFTYSCGRTWEFLSDILVKSDLELSFNTLPIIQGCVGAAAARAFLTFNKVYGTIPSFQEILSNPTKVALPKELAPKWAVTSLVFEFTTGENLEKVSKYVDRLELEYRTVYYKNIVTKFEDATKYKCVHKFIMDNMDIMSN